MLEIIWQHRNDFDAILECEHCGSYQSMKNGYQDARFHNQVIPAIKCCACGKRGVEAIPEGISDPGTQFGKPVKRVVQSVYVWEASLK